MRMDIENKSYEGLLALEERTGNVSRGLSEESTVSRCMTETVHHSSNQIGEEGKSVICLEEYEDSEKLGRPKCGHRFFVAASRARWLQMKNVCPICKRVCFY